MRKINSLVRLEANGKISAEYIPEVSGGAASIVNKTYSELAAMIAANGLTAGQTYCITDRGDLGLYFVAITNKQLSPDGVRRMLCPATYATGEDDYENDWIGVWNAVKGATATEGQLTIWNGLVWVAGATLSGDSPDTEASGWTVIPKATFENHEYIEMVFGVNYDFSGDWINKQWDEHGNVFGLSREFYVWGFRPEGPDYPNLIDYCDWNFGTSGNPIANNTCIYCYNNSNAGGIFVNSNTGGIYENSNAGGIYDNSNAGSISSNSNTGDIYVNSNGGSIESNSNARSIYENSNTGGIYENSNTGGIYENSNNGGIYTNSNAGKIFNNSNTGEISTNSNAWGIISNSNTGEIFNNSNTGEISTNSNAGGIISNSNAGGIISNSNTGDIFNNSNAGEISTNSNLTETTCNITMNQNNGSIIGVWDADVTDTVVDKTGTAGS